MLQIWIRHSELSNRLWHLRTLGIGENNEQHASQLQAMVDELHTLENALQILQGKN